MSAAPVAEFEGVGKCYPGAGTGEGVWAVRGIDLWVGPGEVVGLLGANRAGTSTLAKLLLSLARPTEGRIRRFGRTAGDLRTLARVGYVHDAPAFPLVLTATGLLDYFGAMALVPRADRRKRVPELLERVGLADRPREPVRRFSKGMVQRLALAQALLNRPDLLVLDEPGEGLDVQGRGVLREVVLEHRARGGSALLISHAPAEVERLCDRAVVLAGGRKAFDGPLSGLAESNGGRDFAPAARLERSPAAPAGRPAA